MLNLSNLDVENPSETQVKFAATPGSHKQRHCTLVGHVPETPLGFEIQGGTKRSKDLPDFTYTGKLRPSRVTATSAIPVGLQPPDYAQTSWPEEEQSSRLQTTVEVKMTEQIMKMKFRFAMDFFTNNVSLRIACF